MGSFPHSEEELAQKAQLLTGPEFISQHIVPLVGGVRSEAHACRAGVSQGPGSGRLTLRYQFGSDVILYAKWSADELGWRGYEVLRALWNAGFRRSAPYQVPEPVAFLAAHNLLVTRQAAGKPLAAAFDGDDSADLVRGSRAAARWLAALHRSRIRVGAPETDWDSLKLFQMASRLIEAVAARPAHLDLTRELLRRLREHIRKLPARRPLVQTHGDYHHDHIFLTAGTTTAIDLDRSRPGDPAKDVARFVRVLRVAAFKRGDDMGRAEEATRSFLDEYLAQVPDASASLGCHWATSIFYNFLGGLKKCRDGEKRRWQELMEFHLREIQHALEIGQ